MIHKYLLPFIAMVLIGLSPSASAEDIDERNSADPNGHVHVSNIAGTVTVIGWGEDEIEVTGTLGEGTRGLEFKREGRHTTIKVLYQRGSHRSESSHLVVHVPEHSELSVNGVATDIEVTGVQGVQRLETISGEITAETFASDLEAKSVSGDMVIHGHGYESLLTVSTVSGDTEISGVAGELETTTVSGDVEIEAGKITRARLRTTAGDVEISGDLVSGGRIDCESINGEITVNLTDGANLDVDIETFNGDIENCFGEKVERKSRYGPGRLLRFSRGDGDRTVRLKSLNGEIEICAES
ncbi:MAG: DUF4097 family beta strand repeat protein [Proteobacteria bacterium]|nr:DUF4097 family beta strand repeat protein [Pseudomonadota bacterium]